MIMNFTEMLRNLRGDNLASGVKWEIDPAEGVDFIFSSKAAAKPSAYAQANPLFGMQLAYLSALHEQGFAEKNPDGFTVKTAYVADLEDQFFDLFELPTPYLGTYKTRIEGNTGKSSFKVDIHLLLPDGSLITHYSLDGPFIKLAENEWYRLTPPEWRALNAAQEHATLPPERRTEYENNWFMFQLELAKKSGMSVDLGHFNNLDLSRPETIGVAVEELQNGDLALTPTYGAGLKLSDIKARLGQMSEDDEQCVLRVKDRLILLDQERLEATHEILTNNIIPKEQVATFLKSPSAYLNASVIDLDTGFSLRVHGAERFVHRYFGDTEKSNISWFDEAQKLVEPVSKLSQVIESSDALDEVTQSISDAQRNSSDTLEYDGQNFDISDTEMVDAVLLKINEKLKNSTPSTAESHAEIEETTSEKAVIAIDSNDETADFVSDVIIDAVELSSQNFNHANLKRTPYQHQDEGIRWLLSHLALAAKKNNGSGALLADDMGLGKTYMVLVAIADWFERSKYNGEKQKPVMIVAPLGLLENWQAEVDVTFKESPFTDIVTLQAGSDLSRFKVKGAKSEKHQDFGGKDRISELNEIRYSLKVGSSYGTDRLDMPGRLVLTTYQTLQDYMFSLNRVDWNIVAFDEAQNIKNPNAIAARAAKGLKADFKLLATGTPVENSLKDFWSLMDVAVPGLLAPWKAFRTEYIAPIISAKGEEGYNMKLQIGRRLRAEVGDFMLRRTKADKLTDLPEKRVFSGDNRHNPEGFLPALAVTMTGPQLASYDQIIAHVKEGDEDKRAIILPSLHKLKVCSIHHELFDTVSVPSTAKRLIDQAEESVKIKSMLGILKDIQKRNEKVLIFATTKSVQAYVSVLVGSLFKIPVKIINGDTNAIAKKSNPVTRKGIIEEFERQEGFGVIVMSPVAAGVGLTVVGANNVIHLERHWNPAKEAQATDRVYRIGQKRPVNVYLPMALHPELRSFDLHLNSLLANKIDLSDAVVAPEEVELSDMKAIF